MPQFATGSWSATQVQRAGGGLVEIKAPKFGSERRIFLPDDLVALLSIHVERYTSGHGMDHWLFQGEPGDPPHQTIAGYW